LAWSGFSMSYSPCCAPESWFYNSLNNTPHKKQKNSVNLNMEGRKGRKGGGGRREERGRLARSEFSVSSMFALLSTYILISIIPWIMLKKLVHNLAFSYKYTIIAKEMIMVNIKRD
jgi:hypothetical protein